MREVDARRCLGDRRIRLHVLVPYGTWIGVGALRVLRLKFDDDAVDLMAGYESYRQ